MRDQLPRFALLAILSLCYALPGFAQSLDTRLSRDAVRPILPGDALIQSEARIGDRHLVAWGTTAYGEQRAVINQLVTQIVADGAAPGSPQVSTPAEARPSGFVDVLPLAHQFLLFWNDKRDGNSGAYLRPFDTLGNPLGPAIAMSRQFITSPEIVLLHATHGYRLLWNETGGADSILARDKDQSGTRSWNCAAESQ